MKRCTACGAEYDGKLAICPLDRTPLEETRDSTIGLLFGGAFRVSEVLGEGSLGRVFRARDERTGRDVAVKLMLANVAKSPTLRARFIREARAASAIDHPNVVRVLASGEEGATAYLAMELVSGETLASLISRTGPLGVGRALAVAEALASALEAAHALGIVHRDVKPANVMIDASGAVKLLDFGLAKVRGEDALTATGVMCGTPETMSPEQIEGRDVGAPADLYALGCVLFRMLTGRAPFEGSVSAVLDAHLHAPPPWPSTCTPVPRAVDQLLVSLLAKSPADRPPTAQEARGLIASMLASLR